MKIRITKKILAMPENKHLLGKISLGWHQTGCNDTNLSSAIESEGIPCCGGTCPKNPANGHYECVLCNCVLVPNP